MLLCMKYFERDLWVLWGPQAAEKHYHQHPHPQSNSEKQNAADSASSTWHCWGKSQ